MSLTPIGIVHTAASLIALGAGIHALVRDKEISSRTRIGQLYALTTFVSAATSLAIFQRGGFGPGHVLGVLTLAALALAVVADTTNVVGRASRYVRTVAYSATVLFHLIPGVTETLIRLPPGQPWVASPEAPIFKPIYAALFVAFLVGVALQLRWLRRSRRPNGVGLGHA
jgi:uncharacterized membrane protein